MTDNFTSFENVVYNCDCLDLMREMVAKNIVAHLKLNELDFEELARFGHFRK